jgi:cytochrome c-type biogenesis protein CcmF
MLPLVFLMGIGPIAKWRKVRVKELFMELKWLFMLSVALGVILPLAIYGDATIMTVIGIAAACWAILSAVYALARIVSKRNASTSVLEAITRLPIAMVGMGVAHFGIGVFILGVVFNSSFSSEKEMAVRFGESIELAGYTFTLQNVSGVKGPNYDAVRGHVYVTRDGETETVLFPEKRVYTVQRNPMTEASIQTGVFRDLYVALGEAVSDSEWGLRVYYRPFVQWIWFGTLLMAVGGILGAMDKRYRPQESRQTVKSKNTLAAEKA